MGKIADWLNQNKANAEQYVAKNGQPTDNGMFSWKVIKGLWNDVTGNTQIDKQLSAQSQENALTREYNLQLAKQQNEWNIEQWNRENAYNHPAAQKARLVAAGLNPDMMYGQGGISNTAASSPDMTAGAPATPVDWSSLANKKTVGQSIMDGLVAEQVRANIEKVKAETEKTLADAGLSKISLEYADAEKRLGLKITEQQYEQAKKDYELAVQAIERGSAELEGVTLDNAYKAIRNAFESEVFQLEIKQMSEELKITTEQAKNAAEYYAAQLLGLQADNAWKDAAWIVQQKGGVPTLIKTGAEIVPELIMHFTSWIKPGKSKGKKFNKLTQNGNVLEWN